MSGQPPISEPVPVDVPERRTPADAVQWAALLVIAAVTVAADQVTKVIARRTFSAQDPLELVSFFEFTNTRNTGIAFGQFRDNQTIVIGLSIIAIGWMFWYFGRSGGRSSLLPVALGLLSGGAISNLADRVRAGYVTDFLHIERFPVFNLADMAITAGVILLLVSLLFGERSARAG
jgi:signal peptidase II